MRSRPASIIFSTLAGNSAAWYATNGMDDIATQKNCGRYMREGLVVPRFFADLDNPAFISGMQPIQGTLSGRLMLYIHSYLLHTTTIRYGHGLASLRWTQLPLAALHMFGSTIVSDLVEA
jgi:hypothetical protein